MSEKDGVSHTSTLDHIFWSENICEQIQEADVLHMPDNLSDHSPVYCKINVGDISLKKSDKSTEERKARISWKRASDDDKMRYKTLLERKLTDMKCPASLTHCSDVHCKDFF